MIPKDTVDKIIDAAQITDVVGDFVSLKRRGANYVACCPFHNEKTPSFYVSPSKGIYKCFGCGKSGTAIGFVMEHESMSYVDALKFLARKYGIEVVEKEETAEEIALRQRSESLYLALEYANKFFIDSLKEGEGRILGYKYFKERGLTDETIIKYGLGWAPKGRTVFYDAARKAGYKEDFLIAAGLCNKNEDGSISDRFFDRVIFPIHSVSGRVIAFGGRTLKGGHPAMKYVNSPETEIYVKSKSLYGIYFAKNEIARRDKCFLVEGYLDVLSMHQLGITNVVASSGTSLTVPQIRLIKKFTQNVTIMYDGDSAGINAALRGIGLILKEGLNVKVVLIPDGDDPDSFSRKHSLDEVTEFIDNAETDFISFKTNLLLKQAGDDPLKKAELINDIADTIALIPDAVKRSMYVQNSAENFNIEADILFDRVQQSREKILDETLNDIEQQDNNDKILNEASCVVEQNVENPLLLPSERELLWFILKYGSEDMAFNVDSEFYDEENVYTVAEFIDSALVADNHQFENSIYRKVYNLYFEFYDSNDRLSQQEIVAKLMDGEDRNVAEIVSGLIQENHILTVQNFAASMTALSTFLVKNVPRAIIVYQSKRIQDKIIHLNNELKKTIEDESSQIEIIKKIQEKTLIRKKIDERLGRIR